MLMTYICLNKGFIFQHELQSTFFLQHHSENECVVQPFFQNVPRNWSWWLISNSRALFFSTLSAPTAREYVTATTGPDENK